MERCDFVNDSLKLIQNTEGLTFGTDALLLAGYVSSKYGRGLEIGSGSGIISMLLLSRGKLQSAVALEVQRTYAELTERNAALNGLSDRLSAVCADVREYRSEGEFDLVYTNPPYMKVGGGKSCDTDYKNIARHEVFGDIGDFCQSAKRLIRFGGSFAAVYRPDRLTDLIYEMRLADIEPKRMTLVFADCTSEPSMALIEGRRGGRCGMYVTPPFIIYKDSSHREYSEDMDYVMNNGSFPEIYKRR
ncbi:MAG: methyltransferase [Clostridia bacterium]|nr:methyltransferase [Clostridia bacterium]